MCTYLTYWSENELAKIAAVIIISCFLVHLSDSCRHLSPHLLLPFYCGGSARFFHQPQRRPRRPHRKREAIKFYWTSNKVLFAKLRKALLLQSSCTTEKRLPAATDHKQGLGTVFVTYFREIISAQRPSGSSSSRILIVAQIQILTKIFGLDGPKLRFC